MARACGRDLARLEHVSHKTDGMVQGVEAGKAIEAMRCDPGHCAGLRRDRAGARPARLARRAAARAIGDPYLFDDPAKLPDVDVALVLGAAPIGPEGGPNRYFEYRLDAAAALWRAGKAKYLLVSGDNSRPDYDEPSAMRAGLIARGVPASAIYRDFAGVRTRDSMLRAKSVFGQQRLIVVSQGFHAARAIFLARGEGIEAWGLAARDVDAGLQHLHRAAALSLGGARLSRCLARHAAAPRRAVHRRRCGSAQLKRPCAFLAIGAAHRRAAAGGAVVPLAAMARTAHRCVGRAYVVDGGSASLRSTRHSCSGPRRSA